MNKSIKVAHSLIVAVVVGVMVFLSWAWQYIYTALQKGIADGTSMRVGLKTSCDVSKNAPSSPHFSGCNSIL